MCVVSIIPLFPPTPRLQQHVGIPKKSKGDKVNLEVDVLGKYVERSLSSVLDRLGALEDWKLVSKKLSIHLLVIVRLLILVCKRLRSFGSNEGTLMCFNLGHNSSSSFPAVIVSDLNPYTKLCGFRDRDDLMPHVYTA